MIFECTEELIIVDPLSELPKVAFTKGKKYVGELSTTPGGSIVIRFINDLNSPHMMDWEYLERYFGVSS